MKQIYDYIIVGAGSAGCVLANRLSADPARSVLLLEAGASDWNPLIRLPVGEALTVGGSIDWKFKTEAEPGLDGRKIDAPRGKVLGGSSAINGQLYVRGHAGDFDDWAALGCEGWSYDDVLPYFRRAESWSGEPSQARGATGPLQTVMGRYRTPLYQAFLDAGREMGFSVLDDYNGGDHEGFAWAQFTQEHKRARRCSSAHAYLRPTQDRTNLTILTRAQVVGLGLAGSRCTSVRYRRSGREEVAHAHEVILAAGAYLSPHLLMISGIGDPEELEKVGVAVRHGLKGVGRNLQDHCGGLVQSRCTKPMTYHALRNPFRLAAAAWELVAKASGPLSVFPMNALAFLRSDPAEPRPDLEFLFFPVATDVQGGTEKYALFNGYAITWGIMRPRSRGRVALRSSDPVDAPRLLHNYLTDTHDVVVMNAGFRIAREINSQSAFDDFRGDEVDPGPDITTEDAVSAYNRRTLGSHYHPAGSCRMGIDDDAVVDPQLRVRGIDGLRVVDASIMPTLTSGNTNAPTIMIGEKAAEMILNAA